MLIRLRASGYATPTSIAVDRAGSSSLDAFGLPKGQMDFSQSERLVSIESRIRDIPYNSTSYDD